MRRSNDDQPHGTGHAMGIRRSWAAGNRSATVRWLWLLLAVAAVVVYPVLREDVAARAYDSGTVHVFRGVVFSQAISDGVLFPRWTQFLHLGLGSPLFTFLTPLSYYGMDLFARLGIPHPMGWRLLAAGGLLLGFLGTYLLVYTLTRVRWASLLGAVAFLFAPYVLRNMLGRGTPEAFSMVLYPWVIWSLVWLAQRPSGLRLVLASLLWAACIAGHVLAPLMLAPFAVVVALALVWRYRTATPLIALVAGGLLMTVVWAPMISEQAYVHVERDFSEVYANPVVNPIPLDRLLAAPSVYDTLRDNNQIGDQIGLLQVFLLALAIAGIVVAWRTGRRDLAVALAIAVAAALLLLWMLTAASNPLWESLAGALRRLQYRYRLMGVLALAIAVAAGILVVLLPRRWQAPVALTLSALLILAALPSLYVGLQHAYATFGDRPTLAGARRRDPVGRDSLNAVQRVRAALARGAHGRCAGGRDWT
ncbi:MAG: alpha-(1-_3)-arabinofuranosyltransferase family protein [Caldilineales bacterium]